MKKPLATLMLVVFLFSLTACGTQPKQPQSETESSLCAGVETEPEMSANTSFLEEAEVNDMKQQTITIQVGETTLTVELENNKSAMALTELLNDGSLTISAENYGGFEKVCALGHTLPRNDRQMTTAVGDVCLYCGNQIVLFHGSNSWSYTKLGRITGVSTKELRSILSGSETEITLNK